MADNDREPAFPTSIIGPRLAAGLEAAGVKPDWKSVLELLASCLPTPDGQLEITGDAPEAPLAQ